MCPKLDGEGLYLKFIFFCIQARELFFFFGCLLYLHKYNKCHFYLFLQEAAQLSLNFPSVVHKSQLNRECS